MPPADTYGNDEPTDRAATAPVVGLAIGIAAVSTASTLIRLAQASVDSLAIAAWRLTIASLILAPFALARWRAEWQHLRARSWGPLLASGVMLAIHFYTWIASLELTSVAASTVLVNANPLFVALLSYVCLEERLGQNQQTGLLIAVAGSVIIGLGDWSEGTHQLAGDLLALTGALAVAVYMLIGRRLRSELSLLAYVFPVYGIAALALMGLALATGTRLGGYPGQAWLWLALMAIFPQVVGHSAFNWALGHVPATYVSMVVLAEPIGSTILAWVVLAERPQLITVAGGALILGGLAIASRRPQ